MSADWCEGCALAVWASLRRNKRAMDGAGACVECSARKLLLVPKIAVEVAAFMAKSIVGPEQQLCHGGGSGSVQTGTTN
jgi:hypothetical protein